MRGSEPDWTTLLPDYLRQRGYKSGSELAWAREDALQVAETLSNNGYSILGVDIWLATVPGPTIPTPFVYDWDPSRCGMSAAEFIRTVDWDPTDTSHRGREPHFNILAVPRRR
jgi:hypothetical protein